MDGVEGGEDFDWRECYSCGADDELRHEGYGVFVCASCYEDLKDLDDDFEYYDVEDDW